MPSVEDDFVDVVPALCTHEQCYRITMRMDDEPRNGLCADVHMYDERHYSLWPSIMQDLITGYDLFGAAICWKTSEFFFTFFFVWYTNAEVGQALKRFVPDHFEQ